MKFSKLSNILKPKYDITLTLYNDIAKDIHIGQVVMSTDKQLFIIKSITSNTSAIARYVQWYDFLWWLEMKPVRWIGRIIKKEIS